MLFLRAGVLGDPHSNHLRRATRGSHPLRRGVEMGVGVEMGSHLNIQHLFRKLMQRSLAR
jgi:hypothetical protein